MITAGSRVRGTGEIIRVPVGEALLGRIVDSVSLLLDKGSQSRSIISGALGNSGDHGFLVRVVHM